jgi:long-chain fatty acid transport protein
MRICPWLRAILAAGLLSLWPTVAGAQSYEEVGTRAQGMAGAFVAVADDATASWWNPAGLATGALFNVIFEKGRIHEPQDPDGLDPARRVGTTGFAAAFPSLGLSYYRFRSTEIGPTAATTEGATADRQDLEGVAPRVRTRSVSQVGATFGQSFGQYFVVGSTLKVVRAGGSSAPVDGTTDPLDVGDDLDPETHTRADLDLGVMVRFAALRIGASMRNVTRPRFGNGSDRLTLTRQARIGVALLTAGKNTSSGLTVAADLDLTRRATPFGDVRRAATGAEAKLGRRLAVRGGVSASTIGSQRLVATTGISVAPLTGMFIEGARAFGSDGTMRGWSSTLRLTF